MKLARQLLSKAISQEYIDKSPSSYLKNHVLSFAKSIGDINANTLKKTDTAKGVIDTKLPLEITTIMRS